MITDEVTHIIKCNTDEEYQGQKAFIESLPNLILSVEYNEILRQITLRQTVYR